MSEKKKKKTFEAGIVQTDSVGWSDKIETTEGKSCIYDVIVASKSAQANLSEIGVHLKPRSSYITVVQHLDDNKTQGSIIEVN